MAKNAWLLPEQWHLPVILLCLGPGFLALPNLAYSNFYWRGLCCAHGNQNRVTTLLYLQPTICKLHHWTVCLARVLEKKRESSSPSNQIQHYNIYCHDIVKITYFISVSMANQMVCFRFDRVKIWRKHPLLDFILREKKTNQKLLLFLNSNYYNFCWKWLKFYGCPASNKCPLLRPKNKDTILF